jgi:hypothetical protein
VALLDARYARDGVVTKISPWISRRLLCFESFGQAFARLQSFFRSMEDPKHPELR